jgi:hypothetical protein
LRERSPEAAFVSLSSCQLGIPWEAFETLDPALREALLEKRLTPEELHELVGWFEGVCRCDCPRFEDGYGRP